MHSESVAISQLHQGINSCSCVSAVLLFVCVKNFRINLIFAPNGPTARASANRAVLSQHLRRCLPSGTCASYFTNSLCAYQKHLDTVAQGLVNVFEATNRTICYANVGGDCTAKDVPHWLPCWPQHYTFAFAHYCGICSPRAVGNSCSCLSSSMVCVCI